MKILFEREVNGALKDGFTSKELDKLDLSYLNK